MKGWPVSEPDDKHATTVRVAANQAKTFGPADGRVRNHIAEKVKPVRRDGYGWLIAAVLLFALVASLSVSEVIISGEVGSPSGSVLPASDASIASEAAFQPAQKFTQRLNSDGSENDLGPARRSTMGEGTSISVSTRSPLTGR